MGSRTEKLSPKDIAFIEKQKLFFVATAPRNGKINLSPKGYESLKVIDPHTVLWLNYTGSGNESAAHMLEDDRMTMMFCSFDEAPLILRLYGKAEVFHERDMEWEGMLSHFKEGFSARQIFRLSIDMVQGSCGFGVPMFEYRGEREMLVEGWKERGPNGVKEYQKKKNTVSIDGKETGLF